VRQKGPRLGRNPKTGEAAPISARQIVVFKPSPILKRRINSMYLKLLQRKHTSVPQAGEETAAPGDDQTTDFSPTS
jgi:hypothetical protein